MFISNFISAQEIQQPTNEKTYSEYINKVLEIQDLTPDIDELNIENTGYEGDIRIIKAEKDGKVATKRVIIK